jgi:hypothetical protein
VSSNLELHEASIKENMHKVKDKIKRSVAIVPTDTKSLVSTSGNANKHQIRQSQQWISFL